MYKYRLVAQNIALVLQQQQVLGFVYHDEASPFPYAYNSLTQPKHINDYFGNEEVGAIFDCGTKAELPSAIEAGKRATLALRELAQSRPIGFQPPPKATCELCGKPTRIFDCRPGQGPRCIDCLK